jgi:hypothetical protein
MRRSASALVLTVTLAVAFSSAAAPTASAAEVASQGTENVVANDTAASSPAAAMRALESVYARGDGLAKDRKGIMKSLYRGKWFVKKADDNRRCIMRRESHGNYKAVSAQGLYRGAYQMGRGLAVGATHMMQREVRKEMGAEGVAILKKLRKTPTQQWNRYWQDRAFWTIWDRGDGRGHWRSVGRHC